MTNLYIIKNHNELLRLWRARGIRGIRLLHVDFHDDLRGLFVDRRRKKAWRTGLLREHIDPPDEGNFLAHAVLDGLVSDINWIHGRVGGRAYDISIVLYESDWASIPHRLAHAFHKGHEVPFTFQETLYEEWEGTNGNACLDIDWDFFASVELSPKTLTSRLEEFMAKIESAEPPEIYFCYSPKYVHPSRNKFQWMIEKLSERFACSPVWPNSRFLDTLPETNPPVIKLSPKSRIVRYIRRKGLF
jgi:hypothetical protein